MPNWCTTFMTVSGDEKELKSFLDDMGKTDEGVYNILDTYYPCPKALKDTVSGWTNNVDEQAKRTAQQAENIANYGHADWYEWCNAEWGTKWGDCDTRLESYTGEQAVFYLQSAWSPITKGMEEVSKQFPNLYFMLEHEEEADFYMGVEVVHNGTIICESLSQPCEDWDESMGEWGSDEYCEWKEEESDRHHTHVMEQLSLMGIKL